MNHKIALLMTVLAFAQTGCDNLCPTKKLEKPCDSPCEIRIQENCGGHGCYVYKSEVWFANLTVELDKFKNVQSSEIAMT